MARRSRVRMALDRAEVMRLRAEKAMTFRQIADEMGNSLGTVHKDFEAAIKEFQEKEMAHGSKLRAIAVKRVESMMQHLIPIIEKGGKNAIGAINTYLRAQEQLNRLLGTEAPKRIETTSTTGIVLQFRPRERIEDAEEVEVIGERPKDVALLTDGTTPNGEDPTA